MKASSGSASLPPPVSMSSSRRCVSRGSIASGRPPRRRAGRPLDHLLIGVARHRQEGQRLLPHALERLRVLQRVIGIRADRENRDHRRDRRRPQIAHQLEQRLLSPPPSPRNSSSAWSMAITIAGGGVPLGERRAMAFSTSSASSAPQSAAPALTAARRSARVRFDADRLQRREQPVLAAERGVLRAHQRQRQEMALVAREPRQQTGAQERRFAGTRGAEDHQQTRRGAGLQAAQRVDRLDDGRVAAEEDAGILGFERLEAAIGRAVWLALAAARRKISDRAPPSPGHSFSRRRPSREKATCFSSCEPGLTTLSMTMSWPTARSTTCQVPVSSGGRSAMVLPGSMRTANSFLLRLRARAYSFRHQPDRANRRKSRKRPLRSATRPRQRALPALAGGDAAVGIEIEEDVVPAFRRKPIA